MLPVTLALVAALVVAIVVFSGVVRSLIRQHHRERDLLVNQLCSIAGRPWQPSPASDRPVRVEEPSDLIEIGQWPDE